MSFVTAHILKAERQREVRVAARQWTSTAIFSGIGVSRSDRAFNACHRSDQVGHRRETLRKDRRQPSQRGQDWGSALSDGDLAAPISRGNRPAEPIEVRRPGGQRAGCARAEPDSRCVGFIPPGAGAQSKVARRLVVSWTAAIRDRRLRRSARRVHPLHRVDADRRAGDRVARALRIRAW